MAEIPWQHKMLEPAICIEFDFEHLSDEEFLGKLKLIRGLIRPHNKNRQRLEMRRLLRMLCALENFELRFRFLDLYVTFLRSRPRPALGQHKRRRVEQENLIVATVVKLREHGNTLETIAHELKLHCDRHGIDPVYCPLELTGLKKLIARYNQRWKDSGLAGASSGRLAMKAS
jgi:hypothetical protein